MKRLIIKLGRLAGDMNDQEATILGGTFLFQIVMAVIFSAYRTWESLSGINV